MTFHSGMRRRKVPVLPSTPQGQTRASDGPAPLDRGGTNASTPTEAREQLGVPGLVGANTFTGNQTVTGNLAVTGSAEVDLSLTVDGQILLGGANQVTLDVATQTDQHGSTFPDATGTIALQNLHVAYVAKTGNYTLTDADCVVNVTANSPTITLPSASIASGYKKLYIIKNSGAGTVTLATTSSQTIDGAAPGTVASGGVIRLVSTGSNWISV